MDDMKSAFEAAGYESIDQKLRRLMREAIDAGRYKIDPSQDHFIVALTKQSDRAELLWELFEPVRAHRIRAYFAQILQEMGGRPTEAMVNEVVPKGPSTPSTGLGTPDAAAMEVSARVPEGQHRHTSAPPQPGPSVMQKTPPRPVVGATRQKLSAIAQVLKKSILDRMEINGRPLRNVDIGEARHWLEKHDRDNWFVHLLIDRLHAESGTIGDYISDEEAERIYARVGSTLPEATGGAAVVEDVPQGHKSGATAFAGQHASP